MSRWRQLWESCWDRIAASTLGQRVWAYYEAAAPREQLFLKIACAVLLLVLAWALLMPLHEFNQGAAADYEQQRDTLAWMQANRGLVGTAVAPRARKPGESLLTVANQSARRFGLSFRRYEPKGENGLTLQLEQVPFNQVVQWLGALEREYGVHAVDLTSSRRDEPGMVDVRVVLEG